MDRQRGERRRRDIAGIRRARHWFRASGLTTSNAKSSRDRICRKRDGKQSLTSLILAVRCLDQAGRLREASIFSAATSRRLSRRVPDRSADAAQIAGDEEVLRQHPEIARLFDAEFNRVFPLIERRRALTIRDRTQSLLVIATAVAANYRREKEERGLLDYDDLIDKTLEMLDRVSSSWVHFSSTAASIMC